MLLQGLLPLARAGPQKATLCLHEPGLQCTSIRATNKSGTIVLNMGEYNRDEVDQINMLASSASYEINAQNGNASKLASSSRVAKSVPGLGAVSDGQRYQVACGLQEWAFRSSLCTFSSIDIADGAVLGNFPWPTHFDLARHAPSSFHSASLSMLYVIFPLQHTLILYRIPTPSDLAPHGQMGRNFTLREGASDSRRVYSSAFHPESQIFLKIPNISVPEVNIDTHLYRTK